MKANPKPGKGNRWIECRLYEECLSKAGLLNWKSLNCEACPLFQSFQKPLASGSIKQENTRICEECSLNKTISSSSPLCASCMARKSHKKRPPKKKISASPKRKDTTQGPSSHKTLIGQPRSDFEVVFSGKYGQILKEIEKLAEEEIRTVDEQIIYIIKTYLSNTQHPGVVK